jgi:UDP-3-O-acyl-N-acetylglucosamine deacetylase
MPRQTQLDFCSPTLSCRRSAVRIEILPRDSSRKPRISWKVGGKFFYSTDQVKIFDTLAFESRRTAIYRSGGLSLSTPEHLAPVFLMWPGRSFVVDLPVETAASPVPEIPLMDGSALPFFLALRREAGAPEETFFYDAPVNLQWDLRNAPDAPAYGHVRVCPAETFEVEYRLERPDYPGGFRSCANVSVYSAEDLYRVFQARTFITEREYEQARQNGLLEGVDSSCGLLLKSSGEESGYRVAEEPALHKILDLVGDLTFAFPALPRIRVEILNGGHVSHRQILEAVLPYLQKVE